MLKAFVLLLLSSFALAADDHATISLMRWEKKVVVSIAHEDGWHTYWKNPGDAGIPESFKFARGGKPLELKAYEWPAPTRYNEAGDIQTIGYSGVKHFFFDDPRGPIDAVVGVLICKDICIPNEAKLTLGADQNYVANRSSSPTDHALLWDAYKKLPADVKAPAGFEYYLTRKKGENLLTLHYSLKGLKSASLPHQLPLITGFPHAPWGFKREKLFFKDGTLYGKTEIEWDGEYQEPALPLPESGQFAKPYELRFLLNSPLTGKVDAITLKVKDFSLASPALDDFYKTLTPIDSVKGTAVVKSTESEKSYVEYLLFAFLGGLILNLMPCVLPVISLKLFGLMKHRNYTQRQLFQHNLSYTLGVLSTFMALALVVAGLKAGGEEIGWGFQLQSPAFILVMMLILFVLSLNLFGLFEFVTPGGSKLGSAQTEEGFVGDFFSGVLITVLSTPCSAPFLGTALTFAFTTTVTTIFVMFFAIGLGLAFPFIMTAVFPKTLALFPKPGPWMEKLKYFLGVTLVVTIIWLYDVFVSLVDFEQVSWRLNILFLLWFFAFFFAKKISQSIWSRALVFVLPLALTGMALKHLPLKPTQHDLAVKASVWAPWSMEALEANKGKTVFMDFTAEWCLTCKVNKKLVLETDSFKAFTEKNGLVLMRADWTKRDDHITKFLMANGAAGVPAYFVQKPSGEIVALGETISIGKIEPHLN